jgi:hypothetical protein
MGPVNTSIYETESGPMFRLCITHWISAPALSEVTAPSGGSRRVSGRVFNSPQRSVDYWTRVRYSAEPTLRTPGPIRRCRPTPCRQSSPARRERDRALQQNEKVRRHATRQPELPRGSARQLRHFAQLGRLAVRAEWRRGVGRQARQSGGGIALI